MIVAKLRGARDRIKKRDGRCEGAKPFGFYEEEKGALRRMQQLRADGMGFDRIAETLNTEGLKPRRVEKWWGKTVNLTLSIER